MGYRSGRHHPLSGIAHRLGLLLATMMVILAAWAGLAIESASSQRQLRVDAREPVFAAEGGEAVAHWFESADIVDDRQFPLIYLVPLDASAPPPPGLPRWPRPGEVFISPALLEADATVARRYGTYAGPIGQMGLTDPNEWLVYLRPTDSTVILERDPPTLITGFGQSAVRNRDERTTSLYDYGPTSLYQLLLWCVVLPTVILLVTAVRVGADVRDRRLAMLDALGAPRRARAWFVAGEAAPAVAAGALLAGGVAAATATVDIVLPVVDYRLLASDLRPALRWLPGVVVAGAVAVIAAVIGSVWRQDRAAGTGPREVRSRVRRWPRILFMLALAATIWTATTAYRGGGAAYGSRLEQAFLLSLAIVLLTTPATVATFAGPVGGAIAWLGRRRGWLPALIGGRWLQHRWSALTRMAAAAIVGVSLASLVSVNISTSGSATTGIREQLGDRILTVRGGENAERYDQFIADIGAHRTLRVLLVENQPMLVGDCTAIGALGTSRRCPATPTGWDTVFDKVHPEGAAIMNGSASILVSGKPLLSSTIPAGATTIGVLVLNPAGAGAAEAVARSAYATLGIADVSRPGQYSIGGNDRLARVYAWFALFFVAGLAVLLVSTVLGALDVFAAQSRNLGPVGGVYSGSRLFVGTAAWNIGAAFAMVVLGGGAMAMILSFLYIRLRAADLAMMPWPTMLRAIVGIAGLAVGLSLLCGWVATRSARAWRPAND
ncbi:MAG TPA: hypothetical protein VIL37_18330 [Natronosporangium sp.]